MHQLVAADAAGRGAAHARRVTRVDRIEIDGDAVGDGVAHDMRERLAPHSRKAATHDLFHEDHPHAELAQQRRLAALETAHAQQADVFGPHLGRGAGESRELFDAMAYLTCERHTVQCAARTGLRPMAVHVRFDPLEAERALRARGVHAAPGAHRAGMVAADHHGKVTVLHTLAHEFGETAIELYDRREHIGAGVRQRTQHFICGRQTVGIREAPHGPRRGARIRYVFAARVARPLAGGDANDNYVSHVSSSSTPTEYRRPFTLSSLP